MDILNKKSTRELFKMLIHPLITDISTATTIIKCSSQLWIFFWIIHLAGRQFWLNLIVWTLYQINSLYGNTVWLEELVIDSMLWVFSRLTGTLFLERNAAADCFTFFYTLTNTKWIPWPLSYWGGGRSQRQIKPLAQQKQNKGKQTKFQRLETNESVI